MLEATKQQRSTYVIKVVHTWVRALDKSVAKG